MTPAHLRPNRETFALRAWQRHSLVLAVAGTVYVLIGISYLLSPDDDPRRVALQLALTWAPLSVWGCAWVIVGLLAILSSRWPPASETWGYTTMTGLSTAWAGFYAAGIILGAPAQGMSGVLAWGLVAFMWWAISGLVNPTKEG